MAMWPLQLPTNLLVPMQVIDAALLPSYVYLALANKSSSLELLWSEPLGLLASGTGTRTQAP